MEPYLEFEKKYAAFVGSKYAVSCSSGTAALHLSLLALGVGKGDEVILPDFTMAACGFAVSYCNAKPVFVDVDEKSYGMDPHALEKAITPRTKAIMVVHVYGRLADMSAILRIAKKHRIPIIEDACEAQGAVKHSLADVTVYSLFKNKIIHAEEGGIITTDKRSIAQKANYLKNMTFSPAHDYFHKEIGYNYRLPNAEAILALKSLTEYEKNTEKRRKIEKWYAQYLPIAMRRRDAVWFYEVKVSAKAKKAILKEIPAARDCFKPLSSFPVYESRFKNPRAVQLSKVLVLLPAAPHLTRTDIQNICGKVMQHI